VYGTVFEPATLANIMVFTRQRGEDFYTVDGQLGLSLGKLNGILLSLTTEVEFKRKTPGQAAQAFPDEVTQG
jgi:hypothetical protein